MARTEVTVGGVDIPAGGTVLVLPGAAYRDPCTFSDPGEFDVDRANARLHIAFGHGIHAFGHGIHHCAGAHLARAEGRVTVNRILDRTSESRVSEDEHGPRGRRRYEYLPTYFNVG